MLNYWRDKEATLFALRVSLSVVATWLFCLKFNTQATSAAMITIVIILMAGSQGASIVKSVARTAGTLIGSAYVLFIAATALIDPWLFNISLIIWIVMCVGCATYSNNNLAYIFGMAGMTASIVGFPLAMTPDIYSAFDNTQSRCIGILLGIGICLIVTSIIPYEDDLHRIKPIKKATLDLLKKVFSNSQISESQKSFAQYLGLISKNKQLPIDSLVGSKASLKLIRSQRDSLFNCVAIVISGIKIMRMLRASDNVTTIEKIATMVNEVSQGASNSDALYKSIAVKGGIQATVINQHLQVLIDNLIWLSEDSLSATSAQSDIAITKFINHVDIPEILLNMLRATLVLLSISWLWLETQWLSGMGAMLMAGIMCSMNATVPNADIGNTSTLKAQLISIVLGSIITFVIMPLAQPVLFFSIIFFYQLIVGYQFAHCQTSNKLLWMFQLIFWSSYVQLGNLPAFDFESYLNSAVANLIAVSVILIFYLLIPQRTDVQIVAAFLKRTLKRFIRPSLLNTQPKITSDLILSVYPVLMRQTHTQVHLQRLITLAECLRLDELEQLDQQTKELVLNITEEALNQTVSPENISQLKSLATKQMLENERQQSIQAYSAWWQLDIALRKLS